MELEAPATLFHTPRVYDLRHQQRNRLHGDCTAPAAPCNDVNGSKKREVGSEVNIESRTERRSLLRLAIHCTGHT